MSVIQKTHMFTDNYVLHYIDSQFAELFSLVSQSALIPTINALRLFRFAVNYGFPGIPLQWIPAHASICSLIITYFSDIEATPNTNSIHERPS